jgi:hypothetical protein
MHLIQACHSQKRPNLLTQAQHDYPQVTAFSRPLQFVISATPQADKPATPPSGYTRGLFESGVSVSRLVSWHFRGPFMFRHGRLLHACKTKSKDLHSTYPYRHQVKQWRVYLPLDYTGVSPCVPTYPLESIMCRSTMIKHKTLLRFHVHTDIYIFESGFMASSLLITATRLGPSFLKSTNTHSSK